METSLRVVADQEAFLKVNRSHRASGAACWTFSRSNCERSLLLASCLLGKIKTRQIKRSLLSLVRPMEEYKFRDSDSSVSVYKDGVGRGDRWLARGYAQDIERCSESDWATLALMESLV